MYVLNVSEDVLSPAGNLLERIKSGEDVDPATLEGELRGITAVAKRARGEGSEVVAVSARTGPPRSRRELEVSFLRNLYYFWIGRFGGALGSLGAG